MEIKIIGFHVEYRCTQHITRHQIRSKLDAAEICIDQTGNQACQQCFRHSRHSFYQHMPICQHSGQHQVHHLFLPYNDGSNPVFQLLYLLGKES